MTYSERWNELMGKCLICGKQGFFLKVDAQGMCNECSKKVKIEEDNKFEAYFADLISRLQGQKEVVDIGNNPILALEIIPILKDKIKECELLTSEIHNPQYEKRLMEKLIKNITYRDDFHKRHGMGTLEGFGISVYADPISKVFSKEKILADIEKQINVYKGQWINKIKRIQDSAEFQKRIEAIASVDVKVSNTKHNKQTVSELDELIKYTNITSKTSFDRIGSFVVIDTETTGLSSTRDNLVEIAAMRFEDWIPVEKFHTLLNPGKHISEAASAINNITDEMVADAPTFSQSIESLDAFVGKSNIVGHNLPFDLKFLYRHGYNFTTQKRRYYDTCEIVKKTLKKPKMKWDKEYEEYVINDNYDYDVEDYKLTTLCEYYGIRDNLFAHRALSDALATGELFKCLAQDKIDY